MHCRYFLHVPVVVMQKNFCQHQGFHSSNQVPENCLSGPSLINTQDLSMIRSDIWIELYYLLNDVELSLNNQSFQNVYKLVAFWQPGWGECCCCSGSRNCWERWGNFIRAWSYPETCEESNMAKWNPTEITTAFMLVKYFCSPSNK